MLVFALLGARKRAEQRPAAGYLKPSKKDQMFAEAVELMVWFQLPVHQMTGLAAGQPP